MQAHGIMRKAFTGLGINTFYLALPLKVFNYHRELIWNVLKMQLKSKKPRPRDHKSAFNH